MSAGFIAALTATDAPIVMTAAVAVPSPLFFFGS